MDLRQVVAGILTLTMFVMLGNMIKRDHFDSASEVCLHFSPSLLKFSTFDSRFGFLFNSAVTH